MFQRSHFNAQWVVYTFDTRKSIAVKGLYLRNGLFGLCGGADMVYLIEVTHKHTNQIMEK